MVRVCFFTLLPLILLSACAAGQAQAPARPQDQLNAPAPAARESALDCMNKSSLVALWSCASQKPASQ